MTPDRDAAATLRDRLAADPGALRFAEAVFAQLVSPAGAHRGAAGPARESLAALVADTLLASPAAARDDAPVIRLLEEPALAAAFFQNLDVLYAHSSGYADAVGALLMRALEIAAARESP